MIKSCIFLVHIVMPIVIGALIYVLFRVDTLLVFRWLKLIGLDSIVSEIRTYTLTIVDDLPFLFLYVLPDGLWVYAGTALFLFIWRKEMKKKIAFFWISLPFLLAISAEFLQKTSLIEGSFCKYDVLAYITCFLFSFLLNFDRSIINER